MKQNFEIKGGDILHCTRDTLLSRLIRWATKSNYSHTAYAIEIWGKVFIIDSQKDGTNVRPLDLWLKKYKYRIVVARKKISKAEQIILNERAISKSGTTGYDFVTLIIRAPFGILTGKWLKDDKPTKKMTCSEFVMWVMRAPDSRLASPEAVVNWTLANNYEHKIYVYNLQSKKV